MNSWNKIDNTTLFWPQDYRRVLLRDSHPDAYGRADETFYVAFRKDGKWISGETLQPIQLYGPTHWLDFYRPEPPI